MDGLVARRFEQRRRVGPVGLVTRDVGAHRVGRQEDDAVAGCLGVPAPEVSHAAGLHEDRGWWVGGQEAGELPSRETVSLGDAAWSVRECDLKNGLRYVNCDRRRHADSSFRTRTGSGECDTTSPRREESIPSLQPAALRAAAEPPGR